MDDLHHQMGRLIRQVQYLNESVARLTDANAAQARFIDELRARADAFEAADLSQRDRAIVLMNETIAAINGSADYAPGYALIREVAGGCLVWTLQEDSDR